MKQTITFVPGFDYIVNGPPEKKKYGRHCMEMLFSLSGPKGIVVFRLMTGWMPRIVKVTGMSEPTFRMNQALDHDLFPFAADIGYHSKKPRYPGQTISQEKCMFLGDKPCYYDGSSLQADAFLVELTNKGEKAFWKLMWEYYGEVFGK